MSDKLKIMQIRQVSTEVSEEQDLYCASIGYPDLRSMRHTTTVQNFDGREQPSINRWDAAVDGKSIDIEDLLSLSA